MQKKDIIVPLTVPDNKKYIYIKNYLNITHNSGNLFLFSGDQKIEHLNEDFYGKGISKDNATPKHLFEIANKSRIGAFATQMGLIARYGMDFPKINYIIKVNSKTNLPKSEPKSLSLYPLDQVEEFMINSKLNIAGLGYTVYIGSEYESKMLREACKTIALAHKYGKVAILWMYPRGKAIKNTTSTKIIAGAAGVGACLGADFIKVNTPTSGLTEAVLAAGRTKVICSGGKQINENSFLKNLKKQMDEGSCGTATGRNIHQKSLQDAIKFCEKIAKIIIDRKA